ncbi:ribonuclease [Erwiniaceae bacterium BAC15a-03b]|uniref:Ribonuclease n=1 Tax=Winslowiella arboricola TaxID=2978220 RepID=A0A9J6PSC6_9GAMM|nr:ribonuclease domain-containing protein [Winslowiella arboricola]MCU5775544.1 ribonuclease [Winslowiella arboricola]MCU5779606.1 ribonuclease [Winslowiella arboricola]
MNKRLWIALALAVVAAVAGLRPGTHPANSESPTARHQQSTAHADITSLTAERRVASYLQQHQRLPDYYLTKSQARRQGWQPQQGNLCDRLPGKAIGGDHFANREGRLPQRQGRQWYEADVNYQCGHRSADRLLYSSDGLIFVTKDHYRSFNQVD